MNQPKRSLAQNSDFGKLPPQSVEIEELILGALMLEKTAIERIENILIDGCFYKDFHNFIFKAIIELSHERKSIDILTVSQQLKKNGNLDIVGGSFYLAQLSNKVASTAHLEDHCYIVLEKYIRRKIIELQNEISNNSFDESIDLEDLISKLNGNIDIINELSNGNKDSQHIRDIARKCMVSLDDRTTKTNKGESIGVPTGFTKLDQATNGWQPGDLIVYAARPGVGKTAVMLHHAKAAANGKKHVCIYSLEMTAMSLTDRMIISVADIDSNNYKSGKLSDLEYSRLDKAISEIEKMNIYIDDNVSVNMKYIRSHARKMKKLGKCDIIMIDYLQLVNMDNSYNSNREEKVAQASRMAKVIAKELNIPVILLAQLNRDIEKRGGDKRPLLSDLRESGAIEQDADMVIFIHRPNYYGINQDGEGNDISDIGKLIIAKFRNGTPQDIKFKHNKSLTRLIGEGEETSDLPF